MSKIFKNHFTLKFWQESNQLAYEEQQKELLRKWEVGSIVVMAFISVLNIFIHSFLMPGKQNPPGNIILALVIGEISLIFISTTFQCIVKSFEIKRYLYYFNYFLFNFASFSIILFFLYQNPGSKMNYELSYLGVEMFIRVLCIKVGLIDFLKGLIIHVISCSKSLFISTS